jgi:tetratricopeptide (TPR) repeat protein
VRRSSIRLVLALTWLTWLTWFTGACAAPKKPVVAPGPSPVERLAGADQLVRAGCFDCLASAFREYDELRQIPAAAEHATAGAIRASALLALRERELGMVDDGYLKIARDLAGQPGASPQVMALAKTLDVVDALPGGLLTAGRPPMTDVDLERSRQVRLNHAAWKVFLRESTDTDELAAYAYVSLMCTTIEERDTPTGEIFLATAALRDAPLMTFRRATCRGVQPEPLAGLRERDPRFVEVTALLGAFQVGQSKLDEADTLYQEAIDWRPRWPRVTLSIANVAMTGEEFDRALEFYDKTLVLERTPDALLGRVRALTYLGRPEDAIATVDQLLAQQWYLGDARYWRALNEAQLNRLEVAWDDIELADRLLVNAEVPKLAGVIAYRQQQADAALLARLDVARAKFEISHERNPSDCETTFYLGIVHGDQRAWERAATVLGDAVRCLEGAEKGYRLEIDRIRASDDPPARKERQIARREKAIANGRRMIATSWFNTAVAFLNLSRKDDARQFAEKVVADEQFGDRAREILSRLKD